MKTEYFSRIENATISILKKGGQGILIRNQMILTACHCLDYSLSGDMVLGEYFIEEIGTKSGNFKVAPMAIEPINDIAALGVVDSQEFYDEYLQFEEFCNNTPPIKICRDKLDAGKKFKIYIYGHEKKWITGYAMLSLPESPMIVIQADEPIKGGTSGSGIINENGEIVGIVSNASEGEYNGIAPRPLLALPVWLCRKIYRY